MDSVDGAILDRRPQRLPLVSRVRDFYQGNGGRETLEHVYNELYYLAGFLIKVNMLPFTKVS